MKNTNFWQWLDRRLPFKQNRRDKWLFILLVNFYGPVFLIFFQPFGVNNYDPTHRISLVFILSMFSFSVPGILVMSLSEFFLQSLFFKREKTISQLALWITWTLLLLGSVTYLHYSILGNFSDWSLSSYLGFLRDVGGLMAIPVAAYYFYLQYRSVRRQFSSLAKTRASLPIDDRLIWLNAENGKDKLGVKLNQLSYLEAQDNYVAVYYLHQDQFKKKLLRNSLKNMESSFEGLPLIRCHRSYIVNLLHIEKATGNARGMQLQLSYAKTRLPVSRSFVSSVLKHMQDS